jgi:hypothetical protein
MVPDPQIVPVLLTTLVPHTEPVPQIVPVPQTDPEAITRFAFPVELLYVAVGERALPVARLVLASAA